MTTSDHSLLLVVDMTVCVVMCHRIVVVVKFQLAENRVGVYLVYSGENIMG